MHVTPFWVMELHYTFNVRNRSNLGGGLMRQEDSLGLRLQELMDMSGSRLQESGKEWRGPRQVAHF